MESKYTGLSISLSNFIAIFRRLRSHEGMPSTRDLHLSIIQSRSREPRRSPLRLGIFACVKASGHGTNPREHGKRMGLCMGEGLGRGHSVVCERLGRWLSWKLSEKRVKAVGYVSHAFPRNIIRRRWWSWYFYARYLVFILVWSFSALSSLARINESLMTRFKIQSIRVARNYRGKL